MLSLPMYLARIGSLCYPLILLTSSTRSSEVYGYIVQNLVDKAGVALTTSLTRLRPSIDVKGYLCIIGLCQRIQYATQMLPRVTKWHDLPISSREPIALCRAVATFRFSLDHKSRNQPTSPSTYRKLTYRSPLMYYMSWSFRKVIRT